MKYQRAPLVRIVITITPDGVYEVVRERKTSGESGRFSTLDEAFEFVRAHAIIPSYLEQQELALEDSEIIAEDSTDTV